MTRDRLVLGLLALVLVLSFGLVACSSGADGGSGSEPAVETPQPTDESGAATGGGEASKALVETKCSMCHTTDRVFSAEKSRDEWIVTMDRMKANGLVVTQEEYDEIVEYLSTR